MVKKIKPHLLVIGGTGFIGYHLVVLAKKRGWKITSLSLHKPRPSRHVIGVNYLLGDITKFKELKKKINGSYTYVVNLGGYVQHKSYKKVVNKMIRVHFLGLTNLTKIFLKKKVEKFIQIGSSTEYGNSKAPQNENSHGLIESPYGLAKYASTYFLKYLYETKNFPVVILRLFQVYGPKQDENRILPEIIKGFLRNKSIKLTKGNQVRDFCHVEDVVNAIILTCYKKKISGEIFNIGSGNPLKIKKAVKIIHKKIKKGRPIFGKKQHKMFENMQLYPKINKANLKLKWKPRISFNEGSTSTIKYYAQR